MDATALLAWFRAHARTLPWRDAPAGARDPYRTWVSEVMLQQTRVETVTRYYDAFVRAFPDVHALARASEDEVMKRWEGLGYYRRARFLHAGARALAARGGAWPRSAAELEELPGFGPYTAGAVASIAFGERAAAVDGNVLRVWARQAGSRVDITTPPARRAATEWVLAHQPRDAAGAFNEALMELGATLCTPSAPRCDACPMRASCASPGDALPVKAAKEKPPVVRVALAVARRGDELLLEKRDAGLLAGTWGLPWVEGGAAELREHVASIAPGTDVRVGRVVGRGRHVFTHRVWEMRAFDVAVRGGASGEWRAPDEVALGTAHRRILASVRERGHRAHGR